LRLAASKSAARGQRKVVFPKGAFPAHGGRGICRLRHVHHHIPGVLAHIKERLSRHGVNISAQYPQTNERIGYCVMDAAAAYEIAVDELQAVPNANRTCILYRGEKRGPRSCFRE
jgi:D-3-phosphoglycerate dehydrogenase